MILNFCWYCNCLYDCCIYMMPADFCIAFSLIRRYFWFGKCFDSTIFFFYSFFFSLSLFHVCVCVSDKPKCFEHWRFFKQKRCYYFVNFFLQLSLNSRWNCNGVNFVFSLLVSIQLSLQLTDHQQDSMKLHYIDLHVFVGCLRNHSRCRRYDTIPFNISVALFLSIRIHGICVCVFFLHICFSYILWAMELKPVLYPI